MLRVLHNSASCWLVIVITQRCHIHNNNYARFNKGINALTFISCSITIEIQFSSSMKGKSTMFPAAFLEIIHKYIISVCSSNSWLLCSMNEEVPKKVIGLV